MQRNPPSGPLVKLPSFPKFHTYDDVATEVTIDWSLGPNQKIVLKGNVVVTSIGLPAGEETTSLTLQVQQDGTGSRTIAFVGGNKASPFVLSTAAGAVDLLDLLWDGHVLLVSIRGKAYA